MVFVHALALLSVALEAGRHNLLPEIKSKEQEEKKMFGLNKLPQ